ncbi:hypothetical protein Tco_0274485, partial [Tanacetum coccineum]
SDPEEDLEEDDEEDPEEDPADYPVDRGDDDAEDEHLAPAEHAAVAYSADQDPYIAYRIAARMSIRTQAPTPFLSEEVAERVLAIPREQGGTEGVVNLTQWFERMETVFRISNCTVENQVKFAICTLMGTALTW